MPMIKTPFSTLPLTHAVAALLLALSLVGCGGSSSSDSTTDPPRGEDGVDLTPLEKAALQTYLAPYECRSLAHESRDFVVQTVFMASALNGQSLTTSGTLTQVAPGSDEYSYSPGPQDRLRFVLQDEAASIYELFIDGFQGDLGNLEADDYVLFLQFHQDLRFRFSGPDLDIQMESLKGSVDEYTRAYQWSLAGTYTEEGISYSFTTNGQGESTSIISPPFSNYRDEELVVGRLDSEFAQTDFEATFKFSDDFSSEGSSFKIYEDFLSADSTHEGGISKLSDGHIRMSYVDGNPGAERFAAGSLTLNAELFGQLETRDDNDGRTYVVIQLESGDVLEP